ncbi:hypothetical protein EJ02DRAFT_455635 [Clathrospora elynae]|uniref:21 kDa subunit of NADH dehydrogenase n=1 Tax=Clathrospora elynae TaxID=706981 RepID=A0A6A5SMV9_9PLEO|nr:hypothetical protein EJ02DRAFT_455635 [Clathrospora elynae]
MRRRDYESRLSPSWRISSSATTPSFTTASSSAQHPRTRPLVLSTFQAYQETSVLKMASKKVQTTFAKYTVQPTGIYAAINRLFALDPKRSTGIPMNPQFRNPPPGAVDPNAYDDPVTVPAADIAENPYWKRDVRRRYPRLSTVTQADAVALLEVGSAAAPKQELIGEAGTKQLVAAQEAGAKGLAVAFERNTGLAKDVLGPGGMPPLPSGLHNTGVAGQKRYDLESEQSYGTEYPCRTFA